MYAFTASSYHIYWFNTGATRNVLKFGKYHTHSTELQSVVENLAGFLQKYILAEITMVDWSLHSKSTTYGKTVGG